MGQFSQLFDIEIHYKVKADANTKIEYADPSVEKFAHPFLI